jgi:hypothetical protein
MGMMKTYRAGNRKEKSGSVLLEKQEALHNYDRDVLYLNMERPKTLEGACMGDMDRAESIHFSMIARTIKRGIRYRCHQKDVPLPGHDRSGQGMQAFSR